MKKERKENELAEYGADKAAISKFAKTTDLTAPMTDVEFESAIDTLAQFLLFGTKWESVMLKNPKMRRKVPIIGDVPQLCKGKNCPYALKCPVIKDMKDKDIINLLGTECRAEKIYAVEEFVALVKELQIDPEQTTDIIDVASWVRLLIIKRRIDWTFAIEGIMDKEPGVIDQRTGQVYWRNVVHPLLKVSESIGKQIQTIQKQLMSSREARAALASQLGSRGSNILRDLFSGKFESSIDAEWEADDEEEE